MLPKLSEVFKSFAGASRHSVSIPTSVPFDPSVEYAVLRCSICTGEQVAGFKNRATGHFTEVMVVHSEDELERFKRAYHLEGDIPKEY